MLVEIVRMESAVAPPCRMMLDGLRVAVGPEDELAAISEIVPAKPLVLVTFMVDVPEDPASIVMLPGLAMMRKFCPTDWDTTEKGTLT